MQSREIVRRAIEFESPPRLPFCQQEFPWAPNDLWEIREMDRAEAGWFFDNAVDDDWGCRWAATEKKNMGQVVGHPLADLAAFDSYRPPNPKNPFYFERIEPLLDAAGDRYAMVTCHFNLIERLHMLRGFAETMEDMVLEPDRSERLLDMILEFKLGMIDELARRFGNRIDGLFLSDDWGTQRGTFISGEIFDRLFAPRYKVLFDAVHQCGWHVLLHSCGRVNDFVDRFIEAGADVLNLQQPQAYGLVEFGERFRGKVCFLTTVDVQETMPRGIEEEIRREAQQLVKHWSTPEGGLIVYNYGDGQALEVSDDKTQIMFDEFIKLM